MKKDGRHIDPYGNEFWIKDGTYRYHREDGPAVIDRHGKKAWYLDDEPLTKEEWWKRISDEMKIKALFNGEGL